MVHEGRKFSNSDNTDSEVSTQESSRPDACVVSFLLDTIPLLYVIDCALFALLCSVRVRVRI